MSELVHPKVWRLSSNARRNYTWYVCNSLLIWFAISRVLSRNILPMKVFSNIASVEQLRDVMERDKLNEGTSELGEPISKNKFSDVTF